MVRAKLAGMRKEQEFTVYPFKLGEPIIVQSDKAIGRFDPVTRVGVLNWRGAGSKYFVHLNAMCGAEQYIFPESFVNQCMAPQSFGGIRK